MPLLSRATATTDGGRPIGRGDDHSATARLYGLDPGHAGQAGHRCGRLTIHPDNDQVIANAALELGRWAFGDQPAGAQDADPIRELVRFLEILGGEKDGHPQFVIEATDLLPHPDPAHRVQPGSGLVEKEDLGVVNQRRGQVQASPHAAGIGGDRPAEGIADVNQLRQLGEARLDVLAGQTVEPTLQP
jgi:hypothetical protein